MKHTPGPWSLTYDSSLVMSDQVVQGPIGPDTATHDEVKANMRLIAAAPELLDALKRLLNANDELAEEGDAESMGDAIRAARRAIAKITTKDGK